MFAEAIEVPEKAVWFVMGRMARSLPEFHRCLRDRMWTRVAWASYHRRQSAARRRVRRLNRKGVKG